ncbi:hypothetical protein FRC04_007266 [Tulasnella sp. 424]|nr:hypothetical protein FRC04_007266 [Tulasnella sp. 424]
MDAQDPQNARYWTMWHQYCRTRYQSDAVCDTWNTGDDTTPGWMAKIQDQADGSIHMSINPYPRKILAKNEAAMVVLIAKGLIRPPPNGA